MYQLGGNFSTGLGSIASLPSFRNRSSLQWDALRHGESDMCRINYGCNVVVAGMAGMRTKLPLLQRRMPSALGKGAGGAPISLEQIADTDTILYSEEGYEDKEYIDAGTIPGHWLDHVSQLKPGERRSLEEYFPLLEQINNLEDKMKTLNDSSLQKLTEKFRKRLQQGEESLFSILPEAFAVVREAASRVLGMRHYDVQILGGIALAQGKVAEMRTGEGKTLVAILPAYLYALQGRGAHVITVNDYLARRDAEWVGKVLRFLDMKVGVITSQTPQHQRTRELAADVTYLTAYELAFMYLQDNSAPPSFPLVCACCILLSYDFVQ